jgi:ATP-dependent DNA helicase RecG
VEEKHQMKEEQLITDLIKQGESEQLEFKQSDRPEAIASAVCAFLNANGGIVLIGVSDNGEVIGVRQADKLQWKLSKFLVEEIIPEAPVTVSIEYVNNKTILLVKVWNGSKPPYIFRNTIYFRKGSHTLKAKPIDISRLIIERRKTELHWERQLTLGVDIGDLDDLAIRNTLRDLEGSGRGKSFAFNEVEAFLTYYGLYQNGHLTNAAVALFGREPARYFPQFRVRVTVFTDSKSGDTFSYDRILEGNLFRNIEEILQFFDVSLGVKSRFRDQNWQREDRPFPKAALREGLMNALIHRDYANVSGSVLVGFYPNRLEIVNYGELPPELTPADLFRNHLSLPRNPDIAHICFLRGWIEKIGRGTVKMIEDCRAKGYPEPSWQSRGGVTTLTFPGITVATGSGETASETVNDTVIEIVNDTVTDAVKREETEVLNQGMINALVEVLRVVAGAASGVPLSLLMEKTGKSRPTVMRYLQLLKRLDLVKFSGAAKTGKYYLTEKTLGRLNSKN